MTVVNFQDLPLADRDRRWDGDAANRRVREWADATDAPNSRYRSAFVWYDGDAQDNFTAYKFQIADVIDGKLKAVPRGIIAAAVVMQGGRGGANLPHEEIDRVRSHLARYYRKMGDVPPWEQDS